MSTKFRKQSSFKSFSNYNGVNGHFHENSTENTKFSKSSLNQNQLLIPIGAKWFRQRVDDVPKNKYLSDETKLSHDQITDLRSEAFHQLKSDFYIYDQCKTSGQPGSKREDFEWIQTVLQNGTVADKLAAHTVLVQDSVPYNLKSLEQLLRFVNPKGKRECLMAIDTLRDLYIGDILIPKQKLSSFEDLVNSVDREFLFSKLNSSTRKKFLLISYVEDQIRSLYRRFLDQLVICSHDNLETLKQKSIRTLFDLFINNPEQEKFILESLINKLGDPTPKIASSTARLLAQVLQHHPPMKSVIVKEVERLLFRPNVPERTQYYCLCFLSEIIYQANVDQTLANQVIEIYFTVFTKCTKRGEVNNKTMSILLTGVSRAFPYSKLQTEVMEKYLNTFYRLIHYVGTNTAIQTLSLIFQMVNTADNGSLSDRFYAVLYRFLVQADSLDHCSKLSLLLNICYRAMKKDPVVKRARAFIKRLFQLSLLSSTSFTIAIMILVSELLKNKNGFRLECVSLDDHEHMLQTKKLDGSQNTENKFDDDDEEEEEDGGNDRKTISGWVFVDLKKNHNSNDNERNVNGQYRYDVRNPLYANAEFEPIWELCALQKHFHPTVRLYAEQLSHDQPFTYDGDPLEDFSLKRFLDRFSFKNPKKFDETTPPDSKAIVSNLFRRKKKLSTTGIKNINSEEYLNQTEQEIPVDERFIYKFLQERKSFKKQQKSTTMDDDEDESDIESVTSLEFNDLLDNYEKYCGDDGVIMDNIDYAKAFDDNNKNKKQSKRKTLDDDEDEDYEDEDDLADFDDEDDLDIEDFDDDNDDGDVNDDDDDDDDDEFQSDDDEDTDDLEDQDFIKKIKKPRNAAPFKGKQSFGRITNDIFASAEQFDHLLDQNDMTDSDFEMDSESDDKSNKKNKSSKKSKNIKKNYKKRTHGPKGKANKIRKRR